MQGEATFKTLQIVNTIYSVWLNCKQGGFVSFHHVRS